MSDRFWFTYGGLDIAPNLAAVGVQFEVTSVAGAGLLGAEVRTAEQQSDGSQFVDALLPERVITIGFTLDTRQQIGRESMATLAEAEAVLSGFLHRHGRPTELVVDHRDGHFLARAGGVSVNLRMEHYLAGTIEFVCPSPFLFGDHRSVGRGSGNRVQVNSNYFVEPVILWRTRIGHGAPHIEVDGKRLTIDTQVGEGQQIRIDSARKEVRIGGVLEVEHIHGTFPRLYDGSEVTIVPGGTDISFQYQERWI